MKLPPAACLWMPSVREVGAEPSAPASCPPTSWQPRWKEGRGIGLVRTQDKQWGALGQGGQVFPFHEGRSPCIPRFLLCPRGKQADPGRACFPGLRSSKGAVSSWSFVNEREREDSTLSCYPTIWLRYHNSEESSEGLHLGSW